MERGELRSGGRFAARNQPYYTSAKELMSHHKRLLSTEPAVAHRLTAIATGRRGSSGTLSQTTVRFRVDSPVIKSTLKEIFASLFQTVSESRSEGFEVVVTFNAVLCNQDASSFSLFYGVDHRATNESGVAPELKYGDTGIVRSVADVDKLPVFFDVEGLLRSHRNAFQSSNLRIHSFVNIVYLIYHYVDTQSRPWSEKKAKASSTFIDGQQDQHQRRQRRRVADNGNAGGSAGGIGRNEQQQQGKRKKR